MMLKYIGMTLRGLIAKIPLLGPLAYCSWENHAATLKEFCLGLAFATTTFWFTAVCLFGFSENARRSYTELLTQTVSDGQLFIFAVAFLGPILLIAAEDPKQARPFPGRAWHFGALIFLALVGGGLYALQFGITTSGAGEILNRSFLLKSSVFVAMLAAALRYLAILYRKQSFDPEVELKGRERGFADRFSARHGGE